MIVIHIGLSKSGSSTIQTFLDTHESALRELSVDYPRLGRLNRLAHHNIANELKGRAERFNPNSGGVLDMAGYLRQTRHSTTVLSSEAFWTCGAEAVKRFAAALAGVDQPFRIVLVIRDLVDMAPSSYAQEVRHGNHTSNFDLFFERRHAQDRFNVFEAARRWADAFGWDALAVRVLDPALLAGGDLVTDFLRQLDLDPAAPALTALARRPRLNVSPGWMTLEAVRALFAGRSGLARDHPLARLLSDDPADFERKRIGVAGEVVGGELGWNRDRGRYLTWDQAQTLYDANIGLLEALNAHLPVGLPPPASLDARGFVPRDFMPDARHIPPAALKEFYDAMAVQADTEAKRAAAAKRAAKKTARKAAKKAARTAAQ
jgi:hypothetical protein